MKKTTAKRTRHPYSITFREEYGRSLSREEIRLVQAYRGVDQMAKETLLLVASRLVMWRGAR